MRKKLLNVAYSLLTGKSHERPICFEHDGGVWIGNPYMAFAIEPDEDIFNREKFNTRTDPIDLTKSYDKLTVTNEIKTIPGGRGKSALLRKLETEDGQPVYVKEDLYAMSQDLCHAPNYRGGGLNPILVYENDYLSGVILPLRYKET